ncbi:hypothetical protein OC844_005187 [Tilletia horrida]|nr:hypothetical protein OC844_005187 [Tilletia horrida]
MVRTKIHIASHIASQSQVSKLTGSFSVLDLILIWFPDRRAPGDVAPTVRVDSGPTVPPCGLQDGRTFGSGPGRALRHAGCGIASKARRTRPSFVYMDEEEDSLIVDPNSLEPVSPWPPRFAGHRAPLGVLNGTASDAEAASVQAGRTPAHVRPAADGEPAYKTLRREDAPAPASSKRVPTDKAILRTFLNEQGHALIEQEVRKWVTAEIVSQSERIHREAQQQVTAVLKEYVTSVNAFRSRVMSSGRDIVDSQTLVAADDGYIYLRINDTDLSQYLRGLSALEKKVQGISSALDTASVRLNTVEEAVTAGIPAVANAGGSAAASNDKKRDTKTHSYTKAQSEFKTLVSRLAGLSTGRGQADSDPKIYHFPFPTDPSQWTFHPPTYEPTDADVPVSASDLPGGAQKAYRCLRFDFTVGWNEEPNRAQIMPILRMMVRKPDKYEIDADMTPEQLMEKAFKRTWQNWVSAAHERATKTEEEIAAAKAEKDKNQRRYARKQTKIKRRRARAVQKAAVDRDGKNDDAYNAAVLVDELHSDDYSDTETLPGFSGPIEVRIVRAPAWRSEEGEQVLRSFDDTMGAPTKTIVDRGEVSDLAPHARLTDGLPRWVLKADWVKQNPGRIPVLAANRGPWEGTRSVATSSEAYGSGRYDPAACGIQRRGETAIVLAYRAGQAPQVAYRPFGTVASSSQMAHPSRVGP